MILLKCQWPTCAASCVNALQHFITRKQAKTSLLDFTQYTNPNYRANWHHARLAEKLDLVAQGLCRRLMIFLPPQHGKSELVSRRFPAFLLGRSPDLRPIARTRPPYSAGWERRRR